MQYKITRMGQYYSTRAVSPEGKVKKQNEQRKEDMFIRKEMEISLKLDKKISVSFKKYFLVFYDQSLKYLEKWFDYSDNYMYKIQFLSLKSKPTCSDFKAAVALKLKVSINLDEFYTIKPTLAVFLKDKSKEPLSVSDKWCQIIPTAESRLLNVA
jgi:hypothetical protein